LIEQAQQLGIYDAVPRVDVLEKRPRFHVLYKKSEIVAVDDFDLYEAQLNGRSCRRQTK
jgi:hypothetical protein